VLDADGWFYTGDLATRTEDGAIRILGRRSTDLIKTGGYRVGAGEIEACLLEHPAVREAAIVGAPDDDLGQRIEAFVTLKPGEACEAAELTTFVAEQLSPHKRPRSVHFLEELPRNAMGKVQKKKLAPE
jgi:acyl-coenzyme A synthetase/AMP-(fatty) acid ligase